MGLLELEKVTTRSDAGSQSAQPGHKRSRSQREDGEGSAATEEEKERPRSLFISTTLHPDDRDYLIRAAPSKEIAEAWSSNADVPNQRHSLIIHDCHSYDHHGFVSTVKAREGQYQDGRYAWEMDLM